MPSFRRSATIMLVVLALAACTSKVTPENYDKLEPGMTKAQVHSLLGTPDQVSGDEVGGILSLSKETWKSSKHHITVTFGNDALALKSIDDPDEALR